MANKLKKKKENSPKKKPEKPGLKTLTADKEEKIDWQALVRDERTWKIIGTVSLLIAIFLFISFISYLYTWKEDQPEVSRGGFSILFDNSLHVSNLLGKLGALTSHFFISKGFGVASLLFCTF